MKPRRYTWVGWFVSLISLVGVASVLLGPTFCWCRPWNCLPLAAGPSQSPNRPLGTVCRTTWPLFRLFQPSVRVWKHFSSRPRSLTLSSIPVKSFLHLQWILKWFYYLDHSKNIWLIDWLAMTYAAVMKYSRSKTSIKPPINTGYERGRCKPSLTADAVDRTQLYTLYIRGCRPICLHSRNPVSVYLDRPIGLLCSRCVFWISCILKVKLNMTSHNDQFWWHRPIRLMLLTKLAAKKWLQTSFFLTT